MVLISTWGFQIIKKEKKKKHLLWPTFLIIRTFPFIQGIGVSQETNPIMSVRLLPSFVWFPKFSMGDLLMDVENVFLLVWINMERTKEKRSAIPPLHLSWLADLKMKMKMKMNHVYKIFHGTAPDYLNAHFTCITSIHSYSTRGIPYNFIVPRIKGQASHTFFPYCHSSLEFFAQFHKRN